MKQKTQIGIIGVGSAGLTLALLLHKAGIDCVVLENRSRELRGSTDKCRIAGVKHH